ncbi:MAG: tyrosine-type recombinase/integrase [Anaerovoracaceae bacterium]|nr:tyrosine-type recombinase/integrase [Bacillota bacterium]MDY2670243.1 tyrosine-type recombinase/integrase [Anaerovoracaceae bacterium]
MAEKKKPEIHINNRTDKPDNIVRKEYMVNRDCEEIEKELPRFLRGVFSYFRSSLLPMSRREYLRDIRFFMNYLVEHTYLTKADRAADITEDEFRKIKGSDVNEFLDYCRNYSVEKDGVIQVYTDSSRTLARKKSALSVMFRKLYREGIMPEDITGMFNPIRVQKASEHEIKALQDNEVMVMLDAVTTGEYLTPKERQYWEKTKKRDKAILILFLTYGLRLSELEQLNLSSFNFERGEFKIYRKRNKESIMPLNNRTVLKALHEYIDEERPAEEKIQKGSEDALFLSLQGRRMTQRQIRSMVKKYTSIGMKTSRQNGYSPHKLRATAATSLIGRGNSIYDVQELLDHENVSTTQLYAAHKLNTKRDLIKSFEWDDEFDNPPEK